MLRHLRNACFFLSVPPILGKKECRPYIRIPAGQTILGPSGVPLPHSLLASILSRKADRSTHAPRRYTSDSRGCRYYDVGPIYLHQPAIVSFSYASRSFPSCDLAGIIAHTRREHELHRRGLSRRTPSLGRGSRALSSNALLPIHTSVF